VGFDQEHLVRMGFDVFKTRFCFDAVSGEHAHFEVNRRAFAGDLHHGVLLLGDVSHHLSGITSSRHMLRPLPPASCENGCVCCRGRDLLENVSLLSCRALERELSVS